MGNKPNLVVYAVQEEEGIVTRTDHGNTEIVADYSPETGLLLLREGMEKYRLQAINHLNDKGWKYTGLSEDALKDDESIPPKPRLNPRLGDKTPAYIVWLARYKKKEFIASFGVKQLQILTGYNRYTAKIRDEETGKWVDVPQEEPIYKTIDGLNYNIDKLATGEQRLLADRQSAYTHKLAPEQNTEDYDWDLDATVENRRADGGVIPQIRMVRG